MENKYFKQSSNVFKGIGGTPTIVTTTVTGITSTSAIVGGNVTVSGGTITARGVAYGRSTYPTITGDSKTVVAGTLGVSTGSITGLLPNTLYHVRAYATNATGTAYANETNFTTLSGSTTGFTSSEINSSNYNSFRRTGIGDGAAEAAFDATFAAIAHIVDIDVKYTPEEILKGNIK